MLEIPDAFKPLISDYKFNLIELRKSEYLKFHNDDVNTIFNISRFIFDEIKSLIYTKKKIYHPN